MERDGMSEEDAKDLVVDVKCMMAECNYNPHECELIMSQELGLELDYIFDLI
jgi:hypothetical protein